MIKNYKTDFSHEPHEELELIKTSGSYNTWRIYFDCTEHEDERTTETIETIEKVIKKVTEEDENGETREYEVEEDQKVEKEVETRVYESKYIDITKHKEETVKALDIIKELVKSEIEAFDTSDEVNCFYLNGNKVWLDKDTRVGLMNSTSIQKSAGYEETTLWLGTIPLKINCDLVIQLLGGLEIYALDCFNKTAEHKKNIEELTSVKEVAEYDYTVGYPEKLTINV